MAVPPVKAFFPLAVLAGRVQSAVSGVMFVNFGDCEGISVTLWPAIRISFKILLSIWLDTKK